MRFDPYFKVQWWNETSLAWVDVQEAWATENDAVRAAESSGNPGDRFRIMTVWPGGRRPVREGEA